MFSTFTTFTIVWHVKCDGGSFNLPWFYSFSNEYTAFDVRIDLHCGKKFFICRPVPQKEGRRKK